MIIEVINLEILMIKIFVYVHVSYKNKMILFILCIILNTFKKSRYYEKTSAYECGFDPFSYARNPFSVKFYIIAILFLIFDIEIIFFFPIILNFDFFFNFFFWYFDFDCFFYLGALNGVSFGLERFS